MRGDRSALHAHDGQISLNHRAIVGVQITVEGSDGRAISFLETDGAGLFTVPLLPPGTYRVLAEQVGLQPVRLTGVVIEAGLTTSISFRLERKPPPIERVIEIPQRGATAGATMGRTVSGNQLSDGDRHRPSTDIARDITEVVRTGDARDAWALSTGGLAATSSRLWVDGLPENLTRHPSLTGEPASAPLFQRDALSQVQVQSIGFDSEWRGYPGALFVSAGGYHHHVGLNTWAGVGAPRPPVDARGLDRFEVVLPDESALTATRERITAAAGVEDVEGGVLSVDPSGNAVLVRSPRT